MLFFGLGYTVSILFPCEYCLDLHKICTFYIHNTNVQSIHRHVHNAWLRFIFFVTQILSHSPLMTWRRSSLAKIMLDPCPSDQPFCCSLVYQEPKSQSLCQRSWKAVSLNSDQSIQGCMPLFVLVLPRRIGFTGVKSIHAHAIAFAYNLPSITQAFSKVSLPCSLRAVMFQIVSLMMSVSTVHCIAYTRKWKKWGIFIRIPSSGGKLCQWG